MTVAAHEVRSSAAPPRPSRRSLVLVLVAVGLIAAAPRFYHLGHPAGVVFDETYYAKDACLYAGNPYRGCGLESDGEQSWVHPPLGKWMIAGGIVLFGGHAGCYLPDAPQTPECLDTAFAFRAAAAAFGAASVVLVAYLAFLLFQSVLWAFVAGLLLATESLHFVQSRTSMLDIFLAFWVVLGFLFLVLDRRYILRRQGEGREEAEAEEAEPELVPAVAGPGRTGVSAGPGAMAAAEPASLGGRPRPSVPSPLWRPWRLAAGIALGAAFATKWSGATALAGAIVLSLVWETTRRRRAGVAYPRRRPLQAFRSAVSRQDVQRAGGEPPPRGAGIDETAPSRTYPFWRALQQEGFTVFVYLILVPIAVYLASYIGWFIQNGFHLGRLWDVQQGMYNFHAHLSAYNLDSATGLSTPTHPYLSEPWEWIVLGRPVAYYYKSFANDTIRAEILGIGNPAIFWISLLTIPYVAVWGWARRDWRAGFILGAILFQYVPWFLPPYVSRVQFLFYAVPITPFFVLAATYFARDLAGLHLAGSRSRPFLPVAAGYVVAAVALFVFFYPVLVGWHMSTGAWQDRMWFRAWI